MINALESTDVFRTETRERRCRRWSPHSPQPDERSVISSPRDIQPEAARRGQGRQTPSYRVRCASITSQAFSASANVLKGDPPTLMAGLLKLMGRQEATKPGRPCSLGPSLLSLPITNEKPRTLALHISNSSIAGATRQGHRHDPASR
jgi:hypothetical protein